MSPKKYSAPINRLHRGISLLAVILIGSIMLMATASLGVVALRTMQNTQLRVDAVQGLYGSENVFECVKKWLRMDYRYFSTLSGPSNPAYTQGQFWCFEETESYNFFDTPDTDGATYVQLADVNIATFTVPSPYGRVRVEVERDRTKPQYFDGKVRVYSMNASSDAATKLAERYQEYEYVLMEGADIMFVVDRSGSITNGGLSRATLPSPATSTPWGQLITALQVISEDVSRRIPKSKMGIVTFGNGVGDVGEYTDPACDLSVAPCDFMPEVPLTDDIDDILDSATRFPNITTTVSYTNLSLGLAVAGAELMGRHYRAGGGTAPFESTVASLGDEPDLTHRQSAFSDLLTILQQSVSGDDNDRDQLDSRYPDIILVITDGEPNALISDRSGTYSTDEVTSDNEFQGSYTDTLFPPGSLKVFRSAAVNPGELMYDDSIRTASSPYSYGYCNDTQARPDQNGFTWPPYTNSYKYKYPFQAMCNAALIADVLKSGDDDDPTDNPPIIIAVVAVGAPSPDETVFMRNRLASDVDLYKNVGDYGEVADAVFNILEQLNLLQSR